MRLVRVVDMTPGRRGDVHGRRHERDEVRGQADRPSVYQRFYYYWSGEGWYRAFREALALLGRGTDAAFAAQWVGWRTDELESAVRGERPAPVPPCNCFEVGHGPHVGGCVMAGWRDPEQRRDAKQPRRNDPSPEQMLAARAMYEDEFMTVPEVASRLGLTRGRAYLLLVKAGTTFRRRGRRVFPDDVVQTRRGGQVKPPQAGQKGFRHGR